MTEFTCTLIDAQNPRWGNAEQNFIIIEAKWQHLESEGYLEFGASPDDVEAHGVDLYNRCINGEFGTIAEYVVPPENVVIEEQPSE